MKGPTLSVEESIRLEAYLLSERAGHPHGLEKTFWVQAEAIVHGHTAVVVPSVLKKAAKAPISKAAPKKKAAAKAVKPKKTSVPPAPTDLLVLTPEGPSAAKISKRQKVNG